MTGARNHAKKLAAQQQQSQQNTEKSKISRLSKHVGELMFQNVPHQVDWSVLAKAAPHDPVTGWCSLCNHEKYFILYKPELSDLNHHQELFGWCLHKTRNLLLQEVT